MPARRCSQCDINYPSDKNLCPIHQTPTWLMGKEDSHDTDWAEKVSRWQRRVLPGQTIPNLQIQLLEMKGEIFVSNELLEAGGYLDIDAGSVVALNEKFWEIEGPVYPNTDAFGWWIREVPVKGVFDSARPEDFEVEVEAPINPGGESPSL